MSIDYFLDLVRKSGAIDPRRLDAFLGSRYGGQVPDDPPRVADDLVAAGLLTRYHTEPLLAGRAQRFVLSGKYRMIDRLGSGGMASVFLCEHRVMRRRVAVKMLPPSLASNPSALDRFHREARAMAGVHHPNIVGAHDVDQDGKIHFIVMEYVEGTNFHELVRRSGPFPLERAAHYISQAALGLQHAHDKGLVHRDIKPANLLVDRGGVVKILDLGLALVFHADDDNLTRDHDANSILGTAEYLAPEQAVDSHGVDHRADIYSLGMTMYFLLAAQTPFGEGTTAQKLIWHQLRQPKPIREHRPDLPEELWTVLSKLLAKDPAERYQTMREVAEALAPWTSQPIPLPTESEMPKPMEEVSADGPMTDTSATMIGYQGMNSAASLPTPFDGPGSGRTSRPSYSNGAAPAVSIAPPVDLSPPRPSANPNAPEYAIAGGLEAPPVPTESIAAAPTVPNRTEPKSGGKVPAKPTKTPAPSGGAVVAAPVVATPVVATPVVATPSPSQKTSPAATPSPSQRSAPAAVPSPSAKTSPAPSSSSGTSKKGSGSSPQTKGAVAVVEAEDEEEEAKVSKPKSKTSEKYKKKGKKGEDAEKNNKTLIYAAVGGGVVAVLALGGLVWAMSGEKKPQVVVPPPATQSAPDTKPKTPDTKPKTPDTKPKTPDTKPKTPDTKPKDDTPPKPVEPPKPYKIPGKIEAENAELINCGTVDSPKASGGKRVGYIKDGKSEVIFRVEAQNPGPYKLTVWYSEKDAAINQKVVVNNEPPRTINYKNTGDWDIFEDVSLEITLNAGLNTIKFLKGDGQADLDYIDIQVSVPTVTPDYFPLANQTVFYEWWVSNPRQTNLPWTACRQKWEFKDEGKGNATAAVWLVQVGQAKKEGDPQVKVQVGNQRMYAVQVKTEGDLIQVTSPAVVVINQLGQPVWTAPTVESVLKIGAKKNDTWTRKLPNGDDQTYKLEDLGTFNGQPSAVVTTETPDLKVKGATLHIKYVFVKGVGEVERTVERETKGPGGKNTTVTDYTLRILKP